MRMSHRIAVQIALATAVAAAQVTTSQYDNARTGATLNEKVLTPENVNAKQFGKLGAFKVDGPAGFSHSIPRWVGAWVRLDEISMSRDRTNPPAGVMIFLDCLDTKGNREVPDRNRSSEA